MKRILAIMLALALMLSLAACGPDTTITEEKLKGTWAMELNISQLLDVAGGSLTESFGLEGAEEFIESIPSDLTLTGLYVFDGQGEYTVMISQEEMTEFFTGFLDALLTEETMYAMFEKQGMNKEAVDAAFAAQGIDMAGLISLTKLQMSSMDLSSAFGGTKRGDYIITDESEDYTIEDNTVIIENGKLRYDGTNLLLVETISEDEDSPDISSLLPLTIRRISDQTEY